MRGPPAPPPAFATLNEALAAAARSEHGLTFVDLKERERHVSFAEVAQRARWAAAALVLRGVGVGDRVAIILPTSPSFLDAFFGALLAGAVPVPLYPPLRLGRLDEFHAATARMLGLTGARLVITDARVRRLLGRTVALAPPELGCVVADELTLSSGRMVVPSTPPPVAPDALALIQFSSGSTFAPKPVALTHRQLLAQCAALAALLAEEREHRQKGVSWLPLYHDMGLIGCLLLAVYVPGPLVLLAPEHFLARPALWLRAIARHRATLTAAPSFAFALCAARVKDAELEGMDLSSLRAALNGAEPVSTEVMRRFTQRFARFGLRTHALTPVYGLSEAALAVTFSAPERTPQTLRIDPAHLAATGEAIDGAREIASVGAPIPGVEVEIRDREGHTVPERQVGRIFIRGPSLMSGYFADPAGTAQVLSGGWLDTGDLGFAWRGELYVCGRAKDLIVLRGANHAPQEFEECLAGLPGFREGCTIAVGFTPDDGGETLLILAEHTAGCDEATLLALPERIGTAVLERTGVRPHTVRVLPPGTLPRTSSGKLRRGEALRRYLTGSLHPPRAVTPLLLLAEVARSQLAFTRLALRDEG